MRTPRRDIEIFNVSALDLFASALGAFILIALIIFPYYRQHIRAEELVEQLEVRYETARVEAENARREAAEAVKLAARARAQDAEIQAELRNLESTEAALEEANRTLAALELEADKRVPFALLGLPVTSESFLVVIDMSGSISDFNYVPQVQNTVARIIEPLDADTELSILGYQGESFAPIFHHWPAERRMASMNPVNKREAYDFARSLQFCCGTPTAEALLAALDHPAETIILLSDGEPNTFLPPESPGYEDELRDIVDRITVLNGGRKEIHSVAIGDYVRRPSLVKFLTDLARRNRGHFVGVAR